MIARYGVPVPVWRAQPPVGAEDAKACAATLGNAYSSLYDKVGPVPIVIIVLLVVVWLKAR